jgi:serine/threonine protein kinase
MPSLSTTSDFLALIHKSGVLDEELFAARFPDESVLPESPADCAVMLVRERFLTRYQAKQLLRGRFRGFCLGAYKILEGLGRGGMGTVFLAQHRTLKRRVAIKILASAMATDDLNLERFRREARASAALDHPNIVRLYDIGHEADTHFLVMEHVRGTDLQSFLYNSGPMHYMQAVEYIAQAAAGLQHAHEKGFVHRDIKPANLMLSRDGTIKILDMGLARSITDEHDDLTARLGSKDFISCTVDFTSPEQSLAETGDKRSDIYSLGATLFTLITGRPPFQGNATQKIAQHQTVDPPRLTRLKTMVPEGLSELVFKMMAKDPSHRYQSAAEVIDALTPWLPAPNSPIIQEPLGELAMKYASTRKDRPKRTVSNFPLNLSKEKKLLIGSIFAGSFFLVGLLSILFGGNGNSKLINAKENHSQSVSVGGPVRPKGVLPTGCDGKPLNFDFETGDLKDWTAEGEAFRKQPVCLDTLYPSTSRNHSSYQGSFGINGYASAGDNPEGTLISVPFKVTHPWASFLLGAGATPRTFVEIVDTKTKEIVFYTSGSEGEHLRLVVVDLTKFQGREIQIRLVDQSQGMWGHLNFDDFLFHEEKPNVCE